MMGKSRIRRGDIVEVILWDDEIEVKVIQGEVLTVFDPNFNDGKYALVEDEEGHLYLNPLFRHYNRFLPYTEHAARFDTHIILSDEEMNQLIYICETARWAGVATGDQQSRSTDEEREKLGLLSNEADKEARLEYDRQFVAKIKARMNSTRIRFTLSPDEILNLARD